jgi:hypothetical protein
MSTSNTPLPPPQRTNNTVIAVVIGIVAVFAIIIGGGIFVVSSIVHGTRIVRLGHGRSRQVEIHSPLGDLNVHGQGSRARVDIQSPFGSLHVDPHPDLARLDMPIYPGATLVTSSSNSPFHHDGSMPGMRALSGIHFQDGDTPGAEVQMRGPGGQMAITVAEFVTPATPRQVEQFYRDQLQHYGAVSSRTDHGAQQLEVKRSDTDRRVAAVKTGADGTHFVLVRVLGSSASR